MHPGPRAIRGLAAPAWSPDGRYIAVLVGLECRVNYAGTQCPLVSVLDLETGDRRRLDMSSGTGPAGYFTGSPLYATSAQVTFSPDSSALDVGATSVEGQFDAVVSYALGTGQTTILGTNDCRISGDMTCYTAPGWGQATPSGAIASAVYYMDPDDVGDLCLQISGVSRDCDDAWFDVSEFDVQPVG
jgi:hypothetical protein